MKLTVFIITHGRVALFSRCLESVLASLPESAEARVVVNGPCAATEQRLAGTRHPRLHWTVCPREPRTSCRNRAFTEARGEIIHFLDDDVVVPPTLFGDILRRFEADPHLAVLGGPNLTPADSAFPQKLFGAVMTSPFAAPFVFRRYGAGRSRRDRPAGEHQLILCNLALRPGLLPPGLRFSRRLRSNEENLFLHACRGTVIRYSPVCFVWHERRPTLAGFAAQVFSYGYGRAQQTWRAPRSCHPFFLVPAAALVLGLGLLRFLPWYVLAGALGAALSPEIRALGWRGWLGCTALTGVVHGAYGAGFWWALWREAVERLSQVGPPEVEAGECLGVGKVDDRPALAPE